MQINKFDQLPPVHGEGKKPTCLLYLILKAIPYSIEHLSMIQYLKGTLNIKKLD
jgi:hypothetical protein